jgi:hypothetical protein
LLSFQLNFKTEGERTDAKRSEEVNAGEKGEPGGTAKIDAISKHSEIGLTREICTNQGLFAEPQIRGIKRIDREVAGSSIEGQGHEIFRKKICSPLVVVSSPN